MFLIPLLLTLGLICAELHNAVKMTERERAGVRHMLALDDTMRLVQQHRALRHLQLSGNAPTEGAAERTRQAVREQMAVLRRIDTASTVLERDDSWAGVHRAWETLEKNVSASREKDSYAEHTEVIEQIARMNALVARKSGLVLAPEPDSCYLTVMLIHDFPAAVDTLWTIAGRGAAYIDNAMPEASEGALLNSHAKVARDALDRLRAQFESVFASNAELRRSLEGQLNAVQLAATFLEHAEGQIVESHNRTSGKQFFEAGTRSIDAIHAAARASATELDSLLAQRIELLRARLYMAIPAALGAIVVAAYLLGRFHSSFSLKAPEPIRAAEGEAHSGFTAGEHRPVSSAFRGASLQESQM